MQALALIRVLQHNTAGLEPLALLEAFNTRTNTWHTPAPSGPSPTARGQPAAAADTAGRHVYVFGGWDGQARHNDLYRLRINHTIDGWQWKLLKPAAAAAAAPAGSASAGVQKPSNVPAAEGEVHQLRPCPRADHVMVGLAGAAFHSGTCHSGNNTHLWSTCRQIHSP